MKTPFLRGCAMALALSALPFIGGCDQPTAGTSGIVQSASAQSEQSTVVPVEVTAPPAATGPADPDMPTPPTETTVPVTIKPSPPLAEVIRLANAGVEEEVLLAYAKGSQSAFNLGPDEIIYLTDIGVPDSVVTAMIERDQALGIHWVTAEEAAQYGSKTTNVTAEEVQEPIAAAPTYVNPPEAVPVPEQPVVVNNYNYFYDNLGSYGSWHNLDGYGWCWQPTVVVNNRGWRPYSDRGRWIYTTRGWYWQSDYSWGLTFHYGRWFNHPRRGWCWWPDRTWAPAWVTFRYNDNYCGWAPLPPRTYCAPGIGLAYYGRSVQVGFDFGLDADCYTFVTWRGFCDSRPWRHRLTPHHSRTVINNTTIVNNIIRGDNNTIINRGIGVERVRERSHRPVREVALRDAQERRVIGAGVRTGRIDRNEDVQSNARMGGRNGLSDERRNDGQTIAERRGTATDRNEDISFARDRRPSNRTEDNNARTTRETQEVSRMSSERQGGALIGRGDSPYVARGQNAEPGTSRMERNSATPSGALLPTSDRDGSSQPTRFDSRATAQQQTPSPARQTEERRTPAWATRTEPVVPTPQPVVQQPSQPQAPSSVVRIGRGSSAQSGGQIRVYENPRPRTTYEQPQATASQPAAPTHNWSQPEQRREAYSAPAQARNPFEQQQSVPSYQPRQSTPSYSAPVNPPRIQQEPASRGHQQQPVQRYEQPVQRYEQPVQRYEQPVQRYERPTPPPQPAPRVEAPRQETPRESVRSEPPRSHDSGRSSSPPSRSSDNSGSRSSGGGERGGGRGR